MIHWTDGKTRVHASYCVMTLALASLLLCEVHRRAEAREMEPPVDSIPELLDALGASTRWSTSTHPRPRFPAI